VRLKRASSKPATRAYYIQSLTPARLLSPARIAVHELLLLSSRLIVLVEVARVEEEVGTSGVGSSGKVSLLEKVVLVLLDVEAGIIKEGSAFLSSRRILGRLYGVCRQGWRRQGEFGILPSRPVRVRVRVLEAGQTLINLASGPDCRGSSCFLGSVRAGQVWIHSVPSEVRSGSLHALQVDKVSL